MTPFGLDVELLLMPDAVLAFDDEIGLAKSRVDVSFVDGDLLEPRG